MSVATDVEGSDVQQEGRRNRSFFLFFKKRFLLTSC
jgi:hypothetical protein